MIASSLEASRPSLKFGTHSISCRAMKIYRSAGLQALRVKNRRLRGLRYTLYLKQAILDAHHRIAPYIRETPLEECALGPGVFLKLEHLQHTGSLDREERRVGKECRSRWSPY